MYVGEYVYTYVYNHGSYRDKVMWVRDLKSQDSLDYVVLGSSRAYYHVDPILIEQKTGKKGFNLGYNNSYPFETKLMLKELLRNTHIEKIFIQADYTFNQQEPDSVASVQWMPYIKEENIFKEFEGYNETYSWYKNIPFYRYQVFESQLGIRNVMMSMLGKPPNFLNNNGFIPLDRNLNTLTPFTHHLENKRNEMYADMISIFEQERIEFHFFTAPLYRFKGNFDILEEYLANYTDYSKTIREDSLFSDRVHLKREGARLFTEILIEDYFNL